MTKKLIKNQNPVDVVLYLFSVIFLIAAWVWTVQAVWIWLAVPIFDLPALTYAQTFGVLLLATIFNGRLNRKNVAEKSETFEEAREDIKFSIIKIVLVLIIGFSIAQFI